MVLSLIVVLSFSSLGFTKSFSPDMSFLRNQALNHQPRAQEFKPQGGAYRPEESINQENEVTNEVDGFHNRANARNRTARDSSRCFSHTVINWDPCRNKYVEEAQCISNHVACYDKGSVGTRCEPVLGWRNATLISICNAVQIDCQCK